jgi:hypothetical protein
VVGLIALIGVFVRRFAIWASILFMFLTGSIALGRYVLSLIPSAPGFLNNFFIFEVASFFVYSIFLIYLNLQLNKSSKNIETVNSN